MLQGGLTLATLKLAMVLAFMLFTGPAAAHALVKAAYAHGVKAWVDDQPPARAPDAD
jgi:multisubunit Na+/H+ antiporter MnhG subunit